MSTIVLPTTLHCAGCVESIKPFFNKADKVKEWKVDLSKPVKTITATGEGLQKEDVVSLLQQAGYDIIEETVGAPLAGAPDLKTGALDSENPNALPPIGSVITNGHHVNTNTRATARVAPTISNATTAQFWTDQNIWQRAGFNTLNCLIGCSIGDFGTVIFLQAFYPHTSMTVQMLLATVAGLCTSVALETVILKVREQFDWKNALQTAFSMSFISMIAMELAMNASDFMVTGGKAAFNTSSYWLAFGVAAVAGFLVPLPYNYFKLKKYNKSCH